MDSHQQVNIFNRIANVEPVVPDNKASVALTITKLPTMLILYNTVGGTLYSDDQILTWLVVLK